MAIVTEDSVASLMGDARNRAFLSTFVKTFLQMSPEQKQDAYRTLLSLLEPVSVAVVVEGGKSRSGLANEAGANVGRVREVCRMIDSLRKDILNHRAQEVIKEGTAAWRAVLAFDRRIAGWVDNLEATGLPTWRHLAKLLLTEWLQEAKRRGGVFYINSLGKADTLDLFSQKVDMLARIHGCTHDWKAMRSAWCTFTGRQVALHDTATHKADCIDAVERMLTVVRDIDGREGFAEACAAWVEVNLTAAREMNAAGWAMERGFLTTPAAADRMAEHSNRNTPKTRAPEGGVTLTQRLQRF